MQDWTDSLIDWLSAVFYCAPWKSFWGFVCGLCYSSVYWLFGDDIGTTQIYSLGLLMVLDFILGFCRGVSIHDVSSEKMKRGVLKFIFYGITIIVSVHIGKSVNPILPDFVKISLRDSLIGYLVINEALSVTEHLVFFGVPIPNRLMKRLRVYRKFMCGNDK